MTHLGHSLDQNPAAQQPSTCAINSVTDARQFDRLRRVCSKPSEARTEATAANGMDSAYGGLGAAYVPDSAVRPAKSELFDALHVPGGCPVV